jgi:sulfate permease, SulP family
MTRQPSPPAGPAVPVVGAGMRDAWRAGYGLADLRKDLLAGLIIGIVAVPLAMALAIAVGVPPQYGLYTAIVAGVVIALTGGSRFNVSGPTAAFVVVLLPVVQQYGIGGLLVATVMAGLILVALGLARLGTLIQFVPYPVVLGFTAGIAVVIATLQLPDFLGLTIAAPGEHFIDKVGAIYRALPTLNVAEFGVGLCTLVILLAWPKLRLPGPAPLFALVAAGVIGWAVNAGTGATLVATVASRFTWEIGGVAGHGIPPIAPAFVIPWLLPGADGRPLELNFALIQALMGPAFAIAILAAIESLLCAVIANGLTRTRHDPNAELIGQGLGNIVAPFFGGITATAAIARTATSIRSGARSPLAAVVHAGVVLLAVVALADFLGRVPMAALAALLFVVAWNMSDPHLFLRTLRSAPRGDVAILLTCFLLTVLFDMVLAVAIGVGLAGALFIRQMARMTHSSRLESGTAATEGLPADVVVYDVNGPLFFAAAERAVSSLHIVDPGVRMVLLEMSDVPSMDGTALVAVQGLAEELRRQGIALAFVGLRSRMVLKLLRAGVRRVEGQLTFCNTMDQARKVATRWGHS